MIKQEDAVRAGLILIVRGTRTEIYTAVSVSKRSCSSLLNMTLPSQKKKNVPEAAGFLFGFVVTWSVSGNLPVGWSATLKMV